MRKFIIPLLTVLGLSLGVSAKADEWRLGVVTPPNQLWTNIGHSFAEDVAKSTGDRHSVRVFPAGQLGSETEMLRQMQRGSLDFMLITVSELSTHVDAFNALLAPGLVESGAHAARFLREGEEPQKLLDLLEQRLGVRGLALGMGGMTQVITNYDASGPKDLAGKRIRIIPSPGVRDFNNILGTAPMPIGLAGVYDAFANNQVSAVELPFDLIRVMRLNEHGKTLLVTNQSILGGAFIVSSRLWGSLSDDDKAMVQKTARAAAQRWRDGALSSEAKSEDILREAGLNIKKVPRSSYQEFITEWDAIWVPKVPQLVALRKEAETMASGK